MAEPNYEPQPHEMGELFPMNLSIRVDGPLMRRITDLNAELDREMPGFSQVMWGAVVSSGFMELRTLTRAEQSLFRGVQKLVADYLIRAAAEPA